MKEKYIAVLEDLTETRTIKISDGKAIEVTYKHYPNIVGSRSIHTGLPIWVGKTEASGCLDGGTDQTVEARCWLSEPYSYAQARVIAAGRLLKQLGLPTKLAEQARE